MFHQNLVNYTVVARIKQYSSHTVLAKTGFDKVGHRWAQEKVQEQDYKSGGAQILVQGTGRKHPASRPTAHVRLQD